jgi:hypothetical protein
MPLFRISAMLRPKAVRNVVPSFGRLALAKRRLAKAKLLPVRTTWSTISAVGISTRPLLLAPLDLAPQERLLVSGAHSPRARWAGRRSSRLYAKRLIFSRALARRHQHPAVRSFDLGSCPSFESSTTIISSNLVLLVLRSSAPSCCAFGLVCAGPEGLIYSPAPILHAPPFLSMASVCSYVSCTHAFCRYVPLLVVCLVVPLVIYLHVGRGGFGLSWGVFFSVTSHCCMYRYFA